MSKSQRRPEGWVLADCHSANGAVDDYLEKMPFAFSGTLKEFAVILEPEKLTAEEREHLLREEARAALAVH
jgi:hypothetical protein